VVKFQKNLSGARPKTPQPSDYSKQKEKNNSDGAKIRAAVSSQLGMKKLLLAAAVLAGGVAVSQAGINVSIGIGLPLPRATVIVSHPAPYCPPAVVVQPPVCAPVVVAPPVCPPRVVVACPPPVYYGYAYRYGYRDQWRGPHHGYRHGRGYGCRY
jgi:hypothetical protein